MPRRGQAERAAKGILRDGHRNVRTSASSQLWPPTEPDDERYDAVMDVSAVRIVHNDLEGKRRGHA